MSVPVRIQDPKGTFRVAKLIILSFVQAVVLYGLVGFMVLRNNTARGVLDEKSAQLFLYGGLTISLIIYFGAKQLVQLILKRQKPEGPESAAPRSAQWLMSTSVILAGVAEIPAILGLVLVFLSRNINFYLPFGIFSIALLMLSFPNKQAWVRWLGRDF